MTQEIIRHPTKYKAFNRTMMMDIAKILRNIEMPTHLRNEIAREYALYFEKLDLFFDKRRFLCVADGTLAFDYRTEYNSHLKDDKNDN